jgi:glycosyltransferase involved in cell wall biosynthesis
MNILMLVYGPKEQGAYWRAFRLGRCLVQRGHRVTILATSPARRAGFQRSTEEGISLVETPDLFQGSLRRSGWDPWNALNRIAFLRKGQRLPDQRFDLLHSFEMRPTAALPALYMHRFHHIPWITDWGDWFGRGGSVEERTNPLIRAILRFPETLFEEHFRLQADGATAICTTLRDRLLQMGQTPERVLLLYNGADLENLMPMPVAEARRSLGLAPELKLVGYAGKIFPRDATLLARSFDHLHTRLPESRLVIAGYCQIDLRKLTRYPEAVIQTGVIAPLILRAYLSACDLFWLPLSDTNANRGRFPLKLTDYMALGRPIVATPVGDIPLVFAQAPIGALAPPEPEPFADQTFEMLMDAPGREELGRQARLLAEKDYQWSDQANRLLKFYEQMLSIQTF